MTPPPAETASATVSRRTLLRLALTAGGRGRRLTASTLGLMLHQAGEVSIPILIGVVVDQAVVRRDPGALLLWLAVLGAAFLVLSLSYQLAVLGMVRVFGHAENDLRQLAIARVLHPRGSRTTRSVGEVLSVSTGDASRVAGISWSVAEQGATVVALLAASTTLLLISVPLGVGVLVGAVLVLFGMQLLARPLEAAGLSEQAATASASEVATDTMLGLRIVRGLGAQEDAVRRYRVASRQSMRAAIAAGRLLLTARAVSSAVSVLYLAILALAAGHLALRGQITPGQLVTVVALAQFLQGALAHVGTFGANWAHKRASLRRLHELMSEAHLLPEPTAAHSAQPAALQPPVPPLAWRTEAGWSGAREGQLIGIRVRDAAHARATAAILGRGAAPAPGELRVHGVDAATMDADVYRATVAAPPHNGALFTGSVRENVCAVGAGRAAAWRHWDERMVTAAALDDVVARLGSPESTIGEGGRRLSGGQRQRVLLARALHTPAAVLVLDEPTTALDPVTEQQVAAGLRASARTTIAITSSEILLNACHEVLTPPRAARGKSGEDRDQAE